MGVSSPNFSWQGYNATDATLFKDTAEYTATGSMTTTKILTGKLLIDITTYSMLRLKTDIKIAGPVGSHALFRVYMTKYSIDDTVMSNWCFDTTSNAYVSKSGDNVISGQIGDVINVYLSPFPGTTAYAKNIEICGILSPIRLW